VQCGSEERFHPVHWQFQREVPTDTMKQVQVSDNGLLTIPNQRSEKCLDVITTRIQAEWRRGRLRR
jgi:hypothetical protein